MTNIQGPILGIISLTAAILLFSFAYIEKNIVLVGAVCLILFLEFLYYKFSDKGKNKIKAVIKLVTVIVLGINFFFQLPQSLNMIVGVIILITALYEIFPVIISTE